MRGKRLGILFIAMTACFGMGFAAAQREAARTDTLIDHGWEFRQLAPSENSAEGQWRPAQVPGDVHLDLLRNKLIPDPFYRDNEAKLQWIEGASWEYRTTISITPETLKKRNLELVFDGLDAYAEVFLNDSHVLTANNMFRIWRVNAKPLLHAGDQRAARGISFARQSGGTGGISRPMAPEDECGREDLRSQGRL